MTEILVAIGALLAALIGGWFAATQKIKHDQEQAERERDRCYDEAKKRAEAKLQAIRDAHPDDLGSQWADMAEYINSRTPK